MPLLMTWTEKIEQQDEDGQGAGSTGDGSDFDMGAYEYEYIPLTTTTEMTSSTTTTESPVVDTDGDGIPDSSHNCPTNYNSQQSLMQTETAQEMSVMLRPAAASLHVNRNVKG